MACAVPTLSSWMEGVLVNLLGGFMSNAPFATVQKMSCEHSELEEAEKSWGSSTGRASSW